VVTVKKISAKSKTITKGKIEKKVESKPTKSMKVSKDKVVSRPNPKSKTKVDVKFSSKKTKKSDDSNFIWKSVLRLPVNTVSKLKKYAKKSGKKGKGVSLNKYIERAIYLMTSENKKSLLDAFNTLGIPHIHLEEFFSFPTIKEALTYWETRLPLFKSKWKKRVLLYHPDRGGDATMFERVHSAWNRVKDLEEMKILWTDNREHDITIEEPQGVFEMREPAFIRRM
jgi:hypothetical protein